MKNDEQQEQIEDVTRNLEPGEVAKKIIEDEQTDHAEQAMQEMPEPQEHVIQAEEDKQNQIEQTNKTIKDAKGRDFDPELYKTNADGTPSLTPKGNFRKKSAVNKSHISPSRSQVAVPGNVVDGVEQERVVDVEKAEKTGLGYAQLYFRGGYMVFGDAWLPREDKTKEYNEMTMVEGAFKDWCVATGRDDISPGWALFMALGVHMGRVVAEPETKKKAFTFWQKMKNKIKERRKNAPLPDSGNDGKRQDNESGTTVQQVPGEQHRDHST